MPTATRENLEAADRDFIDGVIARQVGRPGALLGILQAVQGHNSHDYLPLEVLRYVAEKTRTPYSQVYGVATFYALFNLEPQGEHTVCICRGTACHTRGSRSLLESLQLELGLSGNDSNDGEGNKVSVTTPDGRFTVRTVACFGQCALAPVVEVNHRICGHVNERTLQREVRALQTGSK